MFSQQYNTFNTPELCYFSLQVVCDCPQTGASVVGLWSRTECFYSECRSRLKDLAALPAWRPAELSSTAARRLSPAAEPLASCSPPGAHTDFHLVSSGRAPWTLPQVCRTWRPEGEDTQMVGWELRDQKLPLTQKIFCRQNNDKKHMFWKEELYNLIFNKLNLTCKLTCATCDLSPNCIWLPWDNSFCFCSFIQAWMFSLWVLKASKSLSVAASVSVLLRASLAVCRTLFHCSSVRLTASWASRLLLSSKFWFSHRLWHRRFRSWSFESPSGFELRVAWREEVSL